MKLEGIQVLITAGPTREMWDTVRYLSNLSSGKTGFALARTSAEYGAKVKLISSIRESNMGEVEMIYAESAGDMFNAVKREAVSCDIFISAAAVADYRPVRVNEKIKKRDGVPVIELERNPDILKWMGENYPDKIIVGFSLEDKIDIEKGILKLSEKNCKIMVLNDISNLGNDKKTFIVVSGNNINEYKDLDLKQTAEVILEHCIKLL
jgi:phosphopantothenoylcysteine decarboxylase/phosphopantothenate--cysteine ligase